VDKYILSPYFLFIIQKKYNLLIDSF